MLGVTLGLCLSAFAQPPGLRATVGQRLWPHYDKRLEPLTNAVAAKAAHAKAAPGPTPPAHWQIRRDDLLGMPRLVASQSGFLVPASAIGQNNLAPAAASASAQNVIGTFLEQQRTLVGHGAEVLTNAVLTRDTVSPHSGLHTLVWEQRLEGLPVFGALLAGHVTAQGALVNLSSQFVPAPDAIQKIGNHKPQISAASAVALAAQNVGEKTNEASQVQSVAAAKLAAGDGQFFTGPALRGQARARLIWLPLNAQTVQLCWEVIFTGQTSHEMFRTLVDVATGETWVRHNLTCHLSPASYLVFTRRSPTPMAPGFAQPTADQPPEVSRELVTLVALSTHASPQGWLADGVIETSGNNVDAHLDWNGNDVADLPRPAAASRVFDFPLSLTDAPTNYASATVVNAFYRCNWMHDQLYDLGFTEASGNFQNDNFGRGGAGQDAVQADVQDGATLLDYSHRNNSTFSTPPDGMSGRMELYLFTGPDPYRDGGLDSEDIVHEYCHGLTTRLVGGGAGISALQTEGMGEGWSDFYALALLDRKSVV